MDEERGGEEVEVTFDTYQNHVEQDGNIQNDESEGPPPESTTIPPKLPIKAHIRRCSRGKSGSSLEEFASSRQDAFDGDLNPFEVLQAEDDAAASVGDDGYKPIPVPDELGHATQIPPTLLLPIEAAMVVPVHDENGLQLQSHLFDSEKTHTSAPPLPLQKEFSAGSERKSSNATAADAAVSGSSGRAVSSSKESPRSVITAGIESFKYLYSLALLIFCVILVMGAIFTKQTTSTSNGFSTVGAFFIFWFLILWLAMMEGGQGATVGLKPIDRNLYKESHPRSFKVCSLAHKGDNMERFIVGRQFLVVLVVFVSQLMSSAIPEIQLWGLNKETTEIFLNSGIALMVVTIVLGQLTAQLNAANCMLDFINNYFMLYFVAYLSLLIEFSGLLHSVYLVQMIFAKVAGQPTESDENPRTLLQRIFFWLRILFSLAVLGFAFAVTISALFQGKTTMWSSVPEPVSVVLFFLLMCFVGMLEGMQIALFAVVNIPSEELEKHSMAAYNNCQLTFRDENLQSFLIGRQICVTICTFVIARITTLDVEIGVDDNIFGVSDGLQSFFNTGLLGAVITTIVSSLAWRIIGSSFPIAFLSNPLIGLIIRLCLLLEASGVCSSAWVLARYHKPLVGYQPDEVYLEGLDPHSAEPVTNRDKDIDRFVTVVRFSYSLALLLFCVVLVMACMLTQQTKVTEGGLHPAIAVVIFWLLIVFLAMAEGGQGCLVGLSHVNPHKYTESHPRTWKNMTVVHSGDNMQRFIIGRQFLVMVVVFLSQYLTEPTSDLSVFGLPKFVLNFFLTSGLALILTTIILGQLTAQVNAATCMLDFINNYFMLYFVTYLSLAIEFSGVLHSVYFFQFLFAKISGRTVNENETPRQGVSRIFFIARILASLAILGYSLAVTLAGLVDGETTMWAGVPNAVAVVVFFVLLVLVGVMEGIQTALFAIVNLPEDELQPHRVAYRNFRLIFTGQNFQAFLIGRQIVVTFFFFIVARIAILNVEIGVDDNIFGVSDGVQRFFNTGLLGALVTTILASLVWRVVASSFPVAFMSNPVIYLIIRLCLIIDASGICSACWIFARWNKLLAGYQTDDVYLEDTKRQGRAPVTRRDKDIDVTITVIKYIFSSALLGFGIAVTMSLIFTEQTQLASKSHSAVAFVLIWFLLIWLAFMEGGQGALVGLQGIDTNVYKDSHCVTLKSVQIAHKGDNMQRFIVGRQFLVVLVVFLTNLCGFPLPGSQILNLPDTVAAIFVDSGVSLILMTVILGQLTAQVNAATCMLDFINNYFMLYFVTYVSMAMEFSGLLHSVYLVQYLFSKLTGVRVHSKEPPRSLVSGLFFWGRTLLSLAVLSFAFAVTLVALFDGKTTSWDSIPDAVSVIVFFVLMAVSGMMEGMQIALFAVVNLPEKELAQYKIAKANCELTFSGNNLQAFLIGRQICVTLCTFVIARITTLDVKVGMGENIFGVSDGLQTFFNTGLLGAIITTIVGSLAWRIVAASFPVAFLSNPLIYIILRLCLLVEASGLCSAAWLLALINRVVVGFQPDDEYIRNYQQQAADLAGETVCPPPEETTYEQKAEEMASPEVAVPEPQVENEILTV